MSASRDQERFKEGRMPEVLPMEVCSSPAIGVDCRASLVQAN